MENPNQWQQHGERWQESYPLSRQEPARIGGEDAQYDQGEHEVFAGPASRKNYSSPRHSPAPWRSRHGRDPDAVPFAAAGQHSAGFQNLPDEDGWQTVHPMSIQPRTQVDHHSVMYNNVPNRFDENRQPPPPLPPSNNPYENPGGQDSGVVPYPNLPGGSTASIHTGYPMEPASQNPYLRDAKSINNRAARIFQVKLWLHWANPKYFHKYAFFRRRFPESYQLPGYYYNMSMQKHQDAFRRQYQGADQDYYLDPLNGRVRKLFVQTTDEIYDTGNDTSWRRTYIRNISPRILRLAWWPYSKMPESRPAHQHKQTIKGKIGSAHGRVSDWDTQQWTSVVLCWVPTCIGLLFLMCGPTNVEGQVRNNGCYDPVPYRFWSYPKSARNFYENVGARSISELNHQRDIRLKDRQLLPRYLCFMDCQKEFHRGRMDPKEWMKRRGGRAQPTYIFISYTAEQQFERPCKTAREQGLTNCQCKTCHQSRSDANMLHKIARRAARHAKVEAYWTDQCCMGATKEELSDDVYGICDVVRGSKKIVVVVGRTGVDDLPTDEDNDTTLALLKEWGSRMWTWPEVLLSPIKEDLLVYTRGTDLDAPRQYSKMDFARAVWDDSAVARQLIDYYESTMTLSRLELVILALESLKARVEHGTTKFLDGDLSYALMGLLRQRPKVEKTDSAFQAFARLSLANDSDRLLERMICLLPVTQSGADDPQQASYNEDGQRPRHYWTNMNDYWGAKLWDFEPLCQVAGIAENDTVILDGAYGATIHWESFQRVAITTRDTWSRSFARFSVRMTPIWLFTGIITLLLSSSNPSGQGIGAIFLLLGLILMFFSPMLILHLYGGKVWNAQPWLFGFEGHMNIRDIERKIWGFPCGRLTWAPYGSSLSRHRLNNEFLDDECEGQDPQDPLLGEEAQAFNTTTVQPADAGDLMRTFTIVDTHTMTVSMCSAARPPVVALLCGAEGGMQRAVMCSYDWTTQTFHRETVLRMETRMLERIPRIGRVRFGLRRWRNATRVRSNLKPP